jgi:hypothetical protein
LSTASRSSTAWQYGHVRRGKWTCSSSSRITIRKTWNRQSNSTEPLSSRSRTLISCFCGLMPREFTRIRAAASHPASSFRTKSLRRRRD